MGSTQTQQPGAINWLHSLDEALERSRDTGKPVLVDFFSPT